MNFVYDEDGDLVKVTLPDQDIYYAKGEEKIDYIQIKGDDGAIIDAPVFLDGKLIYARVLDDQNNYYVYDAIIYDEDGNPTDEMHVSPKVIQFVSQDDVVYDFRNGILQTITSIDGLVYEVREVKDDFTNEVTSIVAEIDTTLNGTLPEEAITAYEFDSNYSLKKITKQNQELIDYTNPDEIIHLFDEGRATTTYDVNGNPVSTIVSARDS